MMNKREIMTARRALIEAYQNDRENTPESTASALVDSIGYGAAVEIVATMVNAKGEWDGRISRTHRNWAAQHCDMNRDALAAAYIFYCDEIHPAHMDQICDAMMQYQAPAPVEEAQPQPAKTYTYTEGHAQEETASAAQAMAWHRDGRRITVWGHRPNGDTYHVAIRGAQQPARNADDENRDHCHHIAEELEAYVDGTVYRCPDCGEEIRLPDDVGDKYKCPHCGTVSDVDDLEQLGVYDFLSDVYDIEYRASGRGLDDLRSVRVMVACGGPNIYIDTASASVKLYWWTDYAEYPISYDARDAVDEWAADLWGCR